MYKIFGWPYFLQLFLCVGIIVALVFCLKRLNDKARKITQISLISAMGFFLILEYVGRLIMISDFRFGDQMPLNTFQVFVYISIIAFFSTRASWKKFAYLIIAPVSAYGLIFVPEYYMIGSSFSLAVISYVLTNSILIVNSILNMLWLDEELKKRDIIDASIMYIVIVAGMHIINVILRFTGWGIHANYFGTMGDSYDLIIGWLHSLMPVTETDIAVPLLCILPLIAILVGVQFLLVLPFDMLQARKRRQENIEELIALGNLKKQQEFREKNKKAKSQILVRGESKAKPKEQKNVTNKTSSGFVTTHKEIKVNKDKVDDKK